MDSSNLTPEQADRIRRVLLPHGSVSPQDVRSHEVARIPFYDDLFVAARLATQSAECWRCST